MERRSLLKLMPGVVLAGGIPAAVAASPEKAKFDLSKWLETADPEAVADYHASQLAKTMAKINGFLFWRYEIDHEYGFALIIGDQKKD